MAQRRYNLVFLTALLTAAAATYGVYRVLQQVKANNRVVMLPVVVAAKNIGEGERLERLALTTRDWPAGTVPVGAYTHLDSLVGRVARIPIFTGEPVLSGRLAPAGTGPGIEVKIAPGMRAMAVKINDVVGLSGLIQPNSRVDVLVTVKAPDSQEKEKEEAKLFMSNMRVLSVGTQVERGADGKAINATTAALEVTPDEAERLAIAMHQGTIQLVLRGYGDPDSVKTSGATTADVLAQLRSRPTVRIVDPKPEPRRVSSRPAPPSPQPQPAPPVRQVAVEAQKPESLVVRVYRGDKVTQQKFAKDSSKDSSREP